MNYFHSGGLRDFSAQLWIEFGDIVGKYRCHVAGAGYRDIAKARIEQVRMDAGIGVHQDALGSEALCAVAGYGIAMIEVPLLCGVESDLAPRF